MARDRNFQRKQKDARMPARDSHGEDRMAARQGEPDFDLRRARDAPSSGTSRNRRQAAPVQAETYGSDIFAGCENSDTAAQDSPIQVFPGQEPTGSEPYVPETGRGSQGQGNAVYRDARREKPRQADFSQESPGRRNTVYQNFRQEEPRQTDSSQESPGGRNAAYQNFRQEEPRQEDSSQESPGRRNTVYRDSRQEEPRQADSGQESPGRRNATYRNFRQEEPRQADSDQENPGETSFAEHDPKGTDSRYGKLFQESAGAQKGEEKSGQAGRRNRTRQHGNKYQQRFRETAQAGEQAAQAEGKAGDGQKKISKLEFTADELPPETADKKLTKARRKAERTAEKLEQAESRLPARRRLRMETASDPDTGKAKKRLKFEKEVKSQRAHVKGPLEIGRAHV